MTILANVLPLLSSNVLKQVHTDTRYLNAYVTMNRESQIKELIWEFENGFYSPYEVIAKLKEIIEYE